MNYEIKRDQKSNKISIIKSNKQKEFVYKALPTEFLEWQSTARMQMFQLLKKMGSSAIKTHPVHLPVLATLGVDENFPINLTSRGIGILPKEELLQKFTDLFEESVNFQNLSWEQTLEKRVIAAEEFYSNVDNFDVNLLGGLEIFEGKTFTNLQNNPLATILYTGQASKFPSYQFNVIVHTISGDNKHYKFLKAARELFAFDSFHVPQTQYPFGYLYYIIEISDKTPYPRGKK